MPDTTPKSKKTFVKVKKKSEPEAVETGIVDLKKATDNKLELTAKYTEAQGDMKKNLEKTPTDIKEDKAQGILIDTKNMKASPKTFFRKVITSGGEKGSTKILSDDGKIVKYEGRTGMKDTNDALAKNEKESKDTISRRNYNADFYNVQSGSKTKLTPKNVNSLVELGKAVKK